MRFFTGRIRLFLAGCALFLLIGGVLLQSSLFDAPSRTRTIYALDTVISMTVYGAGGEDALDAAEETVRRIEETFSVFRPDSEISRLNRGEIETVSDETYDVLKRALALCEQTGGSFDITLGPLTALWNVTGESPRVPTDGEIADALSRTGYQFVALDDATRAVRFQKEGMALDLGGVVKGYASDEVVRVLRARGVTSACLDFGGNVAVIGERPLSGLSRLFGSLAGRSGRPFRVGIQDPGAARGTVARTVDVSDRFLVTSGDYERYFEQDGVRYHHILDPKTGRPANRGVHSVTIVAEDGLLADALSTAVFVDPRAADDFPVEVITLP